MSTDLATIGGTAGREDTQWYTQGLAATLMSIIATEKTWLDVGAGLGLSRQRIEPHGFRCFTQDPAPSLNVDMNCETELIHGFYGVVSAFDVLEHIHEGKSTAFLDCLKRLSLGHVVLSVPYGAESEYHFTLYTPRKLLLTCARLGRLVCAYDLFDGKVERKDYLIGSSGAFGGLLIYQTQ